MGVAPSRIWLHMRAPVWRFLMKIGMGIHKLALPSPPGPAFSIKVPSRLSERGGYFKLVFYVPENYHEHVEGRGFPVVVNYHGGGFTLGTATDDARWARAVTRDAHAVLVSVNYRLAPEHPYSIGVEDCSDAVIYLAAHADELNIDPNRIALSGFSAGGNFALTVPLLLHDLLAGAGRRSLQAANGSRGSPTSATVTSVQAMKSSSTINLPLKPLIPTILEVDQEMPAFNLCAIMSFYPPTDFRISREEKRKTNKKPEKNLPSGLTDLFDSAYISQGHTSCELNLADPYLSPAAATDSHLSEAYPPLVIIYTCEYDMLNAEGVAFAERLKAPPINIEVKGGLIKEVPHAFDKTPNPITFSKAADRCYSEACAALNEVFGRRESVDNKHQLDKSKNVERFDEDEDPSQSSPQSAGEISL